MVWLGAFWIWTQAMIEVPFFPTSPFHVRNIDDQTHTHSFLVSVFASGTYLCQLWSVEMKAEKGSFHVPSCTRSSSIQFHPVPSVPSPVGSSEAKELRLVSQLAADGPAAQADALALAERIAAQSPVAVRTLVRSLRRKQEEGAERAERDEMLNMLEISDIYRIWVV